jgi:hypothetical protein
LQDVLWDLLLQSFQETSEDDVGRLSAILDAFQSPDRDVQGLEEGPEFEWMCKTIADFRAQRSEDSEHFKYYSKMLDAIGHLVHLWRCQRFPLSYGFEEILRAMDNVMPLFMATGRTVYARYVPFYIKQLRSLKSTMPELYENFFKHGHGFGVPRNPVTSDFAPPDLVLEQVRCVPCTAWL